MIRNTPAIYYRAAATFVAAAVLSFTTHHASAQQTVDLFAGTPGMLSLPGSVAVMTTTSGNFGPGYNGSLMLNAGALNTLSETFAAGGSSNTFTIAQTGVATLLGNTGASKSFSTVSLTPGATYALTLTRTAGSTVGLLNSVDFTLTDGTTTVLSTASGQGLAGVVNLVNLFNTSNTVALQFTVPTTATGNLGVNITSAETAGLLGSSFTFQSATLAQVPEPRTVVSLLMGAAGLALLRNRYRLRAA